jgi:hypothetical protein
MDLKQDWIGWSKYYIAHHEKQAIIRSNSYRDLNAILQAHARKELDSGTRFHMPSTYWGSYVAAHEYSDYMLAGQMRASAISGIYFAFERAFNEGPRSTASVTDPTLVKVVTVLNSVPEAWAFTLALSPVRIRSQVQKFKALTDALAGADLVHAVYLDNLETLQTAYAET